MKIKSKGTNAAPWKKSIIWLYCVILCVAMLTTFCLGWYTNSVVSADNKIQASVFEMGAKIKAVGGAEVDLSALPDGTLSAKLYGGQSYTVTLSCIGKTNGHGSCKVDLNGVQYQTEVFGKCGLKNCTHCAGREKVQFTVAVPEGETWEIGLTSQWGPKAPAADVKKITAGAVIQ